MPIEFRCSGCNQLLRVPETAAGQQAKCPNCSSVQTIPAASTATPVVTAVPPLAPADSANPFAAPTSLPGDTYVAGMMPGDMGRNGPAWERDGKSLGSFWETVKSVLGNPAQMFGTMNRDGGLGAPLLFAMLGSTLGVGIFFVVTNVFSMGAQLDGLQVQGPEAVGGLLGALCCPIILMPLWAVLRVFIAGIIYHLMLMIVGGARQPLETTLRVVAYSAGSCDLVAMVPFVGFWISMIVHMVYMIFGLMHAQEISGGKATLAVLLPSICCCGLGLLGIIGFIAMFAANMH